MTEVINRVCRWCGREVEEYRKLAGPNWMCRGCGRWQDVGPCPCCGSSTSVARVRQRLEELQDPEKLEAWMRGVWGVYG